MTDPVAALVDRLRPVPALVCELLYRDRPELLEFEYGSVAPRIHSVIVARPDIAALLRGCLPYPPCEQCGSDGAHPTRVRTAYEWADDGGFNPNHPSHLCPCCTEEFDAHWSAMWADYRAGLV